MSHSQLCFSRRLGAPSKARYDHNHTARFLCQEMQTCVPKKLAQGQQKKFLWIAASAISTSSHCPTKSPCETSTKTISLVDEISDPSNGDVSLATLLYYTEPEGTGIEGNVAVPGKLGMQFHTLYAKLNNYYEQLKVVRHNHLINDEKAIETGKTKIPSRLEPRLSAIIGNLLKQLKQIICIMVMAILRIQPELDATELKGLYWHVDASSAELVRELKKLVIFLDDVKIDWDWDWRVPRLIPRDWFMMLMKGDFQTNVIAVEELCHVLEESIVSSGGGI